MSITWNVPLVSQPDFNTCWLAALKMMWLWRRGVGQDELWRRTYEPLAKTTFGKKQPMLVNFQIDQVAQRLDIRSTQGPSVNLFEKSLSKGPVMFCLDGVPHGHIVVAISSRFNIVTGRGNYEVADPCATGYPPGPCKAGTRVLPESRVCPDVTKGYIWYWY